MSEHLAEVRWQRNGAVFTDGRFSRAHVWRFDGGVEVPASATPASVPLPMSRAEAVDPEEAFVASLSSCHMLFFLALAAKRGFVVDSYVDPAVGELSKNERGRWWMSRVTLRPAITFAGRAPAESDLLDFHHRAHELCYIANSVITDVRVEPAPSVSLPADDGGALP
jgi:organic hydroperoxide reductase OsmC/OhrA